MNSSCNRIFAALFTAVLLLCCTVLVWYSVSSSQLRFLIDDAGISLATSLGREVKQTNEYNEVCDALPQAAARLAELQPEAEAAVLQASELKDQRKALRQANQSLEQQILDLGGKLPAEDPTDE